MWTFSDPIPDCISIGRDASASVALSDPYVSRIHAELIWDGSSWKLWSRGRNGVYVDGRGVDNYPLTHGTRFRLSSVGPTFRFDQQSAAVGQHTLTIDPTVMQFLSLNQTQVVEQANEIAETNYFRQLQEKARLLRQQRTAR